MQARVAQARYRRGMTAVIETRVELPKRTESSKADTRPGTAWHVGCRSHAQFSSGALARLVTFNRLVPWSRLT